MNYEKLYQLIINYRLQNPVTGYTETHHILPRSLGGSDEKSNLVALTAREHFVCHYLLTKIYKYNSYEWHKMNHAFIIMKSMNNKQQRYFNSRLYDSARKNFSKVMSCSQTGPHNSQHGTFWICNLLTQENKKVSKGSKVPEGWTLGRNKEKRICGICNTEFIVAKSLKTSYCKTSCRKTAIRKARTGKTNKPIGFVTRKTEFMALYSKGFSVTRCLKEMGYNPRCGDKRKFIKQWIKSGV